MYYFMFDNYSSRNQAIANINEYEKKVCEDCGAIFTSLKGIYQFRVMGSLRDYYLVSGTPVISERFLNVLLENCYTGYEISETKTFKGTVTKIGDPLKEKYYRLKVTGRCGLLRNVNNEELPHCKKCGARFLQTGLLTEGISFDDTQYDGCDIFAFNNMSNIPIVSEKIRDLIIEKKFTNINFIHLNEKVFDDRISQNLVNKWLAEGKASNELIEAWLKYGVLTEQELNEQLDKSND